MRHPISDKVLKGLLIVCLVFVGLGSVEVCANASANDNDNDALICDGYDQPISINNRQVLHWKRTTANQYRDRANVQGPILKILKLKGDHMHLAVQIGKRGTDSIEVIYNQAFGKLEEPKLGWKVQACGDYITSTHPSGKYPASPLGAIIHWVHANPRGQGHQNGFLVVNDRLYGQDLENVKPREENNPNHYGWDYFELAPSLYFMAPSDESGL